METGGEDVSGTLRGRAREAPPGAFRGSEAILRDRRKARQRMSWPIRALFVL